jgi:hypothetical protein
MRFGVVQDKGPWRKRYNRELHKLFNEADKHNRSEMVAVLGPFEALSYYIHNEADITKYIKLNRLH